MMRPVQSLSTFIYEYLKTRIELGFYQRGEQLPTLRELSELFSVSLATVKSAVNRLAEDGLVKADKAMRPVVTAPFSPEELRENLVRHAGERRRSFVEAEVCFSYFMPAFMEEGLRRFTDEDFLKLSQYLTLMEEGNIRFVSSFTCKILSKLKNPLCTRLYMTSELYYSTIYERMCRDGLWKGSGIYKLMMDAYTKLLHFSWVKNWNKVQDILVFIYRDIFTPYQQSIRAEQTGLESVPQTSFIWEIHGQRPQIYMLIVSDVVKSIVKRIYQTGQYLPSESALVEKYQTTVITVRRAVVYLSAMGLVKNVQGKGIWVLPFGMRKEYADYRDSQHRQNLITYLQAMQIISLTSKRIAADTFHSLPPDRWEEMERWLSVAMKEGNAFLALDVCLDAISEHNRYAVVRNVYAQLALLYCWGYSLAPLLLHKSEWFTAADRLREAFIRKDAALFGEAVQRLAETMYRASGEIAHSLGIIDRRSAGAV